MINVNCMNAFFEFAFRLKMIMYAVMIRLRKKNAGWITLNLWPLSIYKSSVPSVFFDCLFKKNSNFISNATIVIDGKMIKAARPSTDKSLVKLNQDFFYTSVVELLNTPSIVSRSKSK